jgi:hypothetical protein
MDRAVSAEVGRSLAPDSGGGFVQSQTVLDPDQLARLAAEHSARFAELHGPATKAELLDALREVLALPAYTGSNWDALEEVLSYPERGGAVLLAWYNPQRLPTRDAATFEAIVEAAAGVRASASDGALVVVAGPSDEAVRASP